MLFKVNTHCIFVMVALHYFLSLGQYKKLKTWRDNVTWRLSPTRWADQTFFVMSVGVSCRHASSVSVWCKECFLPTSFPFLMLHLSFGFCVLIKLCDNNFKTDYSVRFPQKHRKSWQNLVCNKKNVWLVSYKVWFQTGHRYWSAW